ncbi:hypothetical protein N864_02735 [Intrasporangium chromatireducens Q5-1]|uniref:Uncharacterized protein n=1 Tax=Intrasporangium chromatireducens Q5-1 TaxID=584657 RepID=W9GLM9_9MICO|nr:PucR family transcriptional regulator [Intrasporangium chromatireducens]EWT05743.1 hypothetical protein N864_02735 [Intrasporangium chromatireducens Q5-1]
MNDLRQGGPVGESITLAELLRTEPMRAVQLHALAGLDRVVDEVRLVDDVEQVRAARPGTLVVLQHGIARTAWSTAIAVRYAWERNVRAVICELDMVAAPSVISLAERLSVPLGIHGGDLAALALELSAIVAYPEASRARLVARCAELVAQQYDVDSILAVVQSELPGVQVTLHTPPRHTEGQATAAPEPSIRVPMGRLDVRQGRELLATLERGSVAWARTVHAVLEIARAQIIACEAAAQIGLAQRRQLEEWTLRQLVEPGPRGGGHPGWREQLAPAGPGGQLHRPEARAAAERLGWRLGPRVIAGSIVPLDTDMPVDDDLDLTLAAAWPQGLDLAGPVRHGEGWGVWISFEDELETGSPEQARTLERRALRTLSATLQRCLEQVSIGITLLAGVGTPVGADGLATSLRHAELAARAARDRPGQPPQSFTDLGARAFLAAVDGPALRELALETLAPLASVEDGIVLAQTLGAYLDCGGSTGRAAELLGVHRNTVTGRIDRIRRLGVDIEAPGTRLGIHMAAHLLGR